MTKFEENLRTAFSESQYDLCMRNREEDLRYRQLEEEYSKLFDHIRDRLGKKHRKLMLKLEQMGNEKGSIDDDLLYLQGMIDCVKRLKAIKMI